jgi:pimeloyl-ACP methyl ester carboxylesterase
MFQRLVIFLVLLGLVSCATTSKKDKQLPVTKKEIALHLVDDMSEGEYEAVKTNFNELMMKALSPTMIKNVWKRLVKKDGKYKSHGFLNEKGDKVFIRVDFEKAFYVFRIVFDKTNKVSGLFTGSPMPKENLDRLTSFDGFELPYIIDEPSGESRGVFVFIHGSGPGGVEGTDTKLFSEIAKKLNQAGFTTVRYNKRSLEIQKLASQGNNYMESNEFKKFDRDFYLYFMRDARAVIKFAKKKFKDQPVYLYGLSQGANIALQLADSEKEVKGAVLTGFSVSRINETIFYQYVFRNDYFFNQSDKNRDGKLCRKELLKNLKAQLSFLDMNGNQCMDLDEYRAGNYSNILVQPKKNYDNWLRNEMSLKPVTEILQSLHKNILFFHGEHDHQTPSFQLKALQMINKLKWKNNHLKFSYLKNVGHVLNDQKTLVEFNYAPASEKTLSRLVKEVELMVKPVHQH